MHFAASGTSGIDIRVDMTDPVCEVYVYMQDQYHYSYTGIDFPCNASDFHLIKVTWHPEEEFKIYVNDTFIDVFETTGYINSWEYEYINSNGLGSNMNLGYISTYRQMDGYIDEFKIYETALRIGNLSNETLSGNTSGLKCFLSFDYESFVCDILKTLSWEFEMICLYLLLYRGSIQFVCTI